MRICFIPSGWLRRTIGLLALLPALAHVGSAAAQTGSPDLAAAKYYTKDPGFHLPIKIDDRLRGNIREVQLYMKVGNGDWQRKDVAAPWAQSFKFRAPADGEYWFTLVTIDNKGVPTPGDLNRLSPNDVVMVIVDTVAPVCDLQPVKLANGDVVVHCTINDANPDYKSLKITYQGNDQLIRILEQLPGPGGHFRVPGPEALANSLRVATTDLAGNSSIREVSLQDSVAKLWPSQSPTTVVQASSSAPLKSSGVQQVSGAAPNGVGTGTGQSNPPQSVQANAPALEPAPAPPQPAQNIVPPIESRPLTQPAQNISQPVETRPTQTAVPVEPRPTITSLTSPSSAAPGGSIQRQILNTTRASLDYHIEQVGPSGVGKVEVWMTSDQGGNWKRLCEDVDRRSPAEFDLPGDGLFGVRVAVTNGNGFGGRAPAPGELPQLWIEVDTIAPNVQLKEVEPTTNGGTIDIRWTASDKNFGPEPINLYFATRREGPWQPMARGLKNDGSYQWAFPRDAGSQFFVRLEATDLAGNLARADSPNAIVLDMTEPKASVVGVTGVQAAVQPNRGN